MILEQHFLGCLAQASYFIADKSTSKALVVDPRRDVDIYLERAEALGTEICAVLLTHSHADFLAGHLELQSATGATIYMGAAAQVEFDMQPLRDGQVLTVGQVQITALATPGHTLDSTCYLVHDLAESSEQPHAVLTGDTLFIGDVGRPDLSSGEGPGAAEMAGMLFDSLRSKLLPLPDETLVYPGHGAGSACGRSMSQERSSTMGVQRTENYALGNLSREAFVTEVVPNQPMIPAYFLRAVQLNQTQHDLLPQVLERALRPLDLAAFQELQDEGAQVLDVRPAAQFQEGHLEGSLWVGLDGQFATWCGTVLDLEAPVLIVGEEQQAQEAVTRLGRVGVDNVQGYLAEASTVLAGVQELACVSRLTVEEAQQALADAEAPTVLDVRQPGEYEAGHLEAAMNIPLGQLGARSGEVSEARRLVLHCKSGYRSLVALSLLRAHGMKTAQIQDVLGGFDAWSAAGGRVVQEANDSGPASACNA